MLLELIFNILLNNVTHARTHARTHTRHCLSLGSCRSQKVLGDQPIMESDLWCTSDVRISNTTFMWKIKGFKFSNYTYNLEGIKTGVFVIRGGEGDIKRDTKWMLEIKPGTILTTGGQHIRVNLHSKNIGITKPDVVLQMVNSSKARQVFGTVRKNSHLYWRIIL